MNVVLLRGTLYGDPTDVTLASGESIRTWELATDSPTGTGHKVPIRWVEPTKAVRAFVDGDEVVVFGAVRRRFFRAGGATASRTEVLGSKVAKTSRKRAVAKLLTDVQESLA